MYIYIYIYEVFVFKSIRIINSLYIIKYNSLSQLATVSFSLCLTYILSGSLLHFLCLPPCYFSLSLSLFLSLSSALYIYLLFFSGSLRDLDKNKLSSIDNFIHRLVFAGEKYLEKVLNCCGWVSWVNGISTFMCFFKPKPLYNLLTKYI